MLYRCRAVSARPVRSVMQVAGSVFTFIMARSDIFTGLVALIDLQVGVEVEVWGLKLTKRIW